MSRTTIEILYFVKLIAAVFLLTSCAKDNDDVFYTNYGTPLAHPLPFEYVLSEYDANREIYVDINSSTAVDAEKSALVLIDVWQNEFLDTLVINSINPLIRRFDVMGAKVIYAPSIEPHNENLTILDGSISFYEEEEMDDYLEVHGIQNLFYVGFDTFYCILDKQNGMYSMRTRNKDLNLYLIDQGVQSYTREMKNTAMELLKKNDVGIVNFPAFDQKMTYPQNTNFDIFAKTKDKIRPGNTFVTLFKNEEKDHELEKFERELVDLDINYAIVSDNRLYYKGRELSKPDYIRLLQDLETSNHYYAGFHLNNEILWSNFGIRSLYIEARYNKVPLPWPYIVNDLAFMVPSEAIDTEIEKATIINHGRIAHNIESRTLINNLKVADKSTGKSNK